MPGNFLTRFLINRDIFGHSLNLVYKGHDAHNSVIGGILTLLVKGLTMTMIFQALLEIAFM